MVRLHPLPEGANSQLAEVLGKAIAGAVRATLDAHGHRVPADVCGLLVGSVRKRAVNQLVCVDGEVAIRRALDERG